MSGAGETLCTITEAAARLNVDVRTVRRWIRSGAPIAAHGRRGRGSGHRIDLEALRAWRRGQDVPGPMSAEDAARIIGSSLAEIIAKTLDEHLRNLEGSHKRAVAAEFCEVYLPLVRAVLDPHQLLAAVETPQRIPEVLARWAFAAK